MLAIALRNLALIALATVVLGCSAGSSDRAASVPTVRDSAGIQIVENPPVNDADLPFWSVDTVPSVTIGQLDGDPAYEFETIQGVTQLANGMIVVVEGRGESTVGLRFFTPEGRHVATHGRSGDGPGEYRWVNYISGVGGDTVMAVDFPLKRINWISASRGFLRSAQVDEAAFKRMLGADILSVAEGLSPFSDSLFAVKSWRPDSAATTPFALTTQFDIVDFRRDTVHHVAHYREPSRIQINLARGPRWVSSVVDFAWGVHFVDAERARLCGLLTSVAEMHCVDAEGKRQTIRWQPPSIPFTAEDRREYEERMRTNYAKDPTSNAPGDVDKVLAIKEWPTNYHPVRAVKGDADGNAWVLEYAPDTAQRKILRFRVLDARGPQIAFASGFELLPVALNNPVYIGSTAILRLITNADGVEQIAVFPIRR